MVTLVTIVRYQASNLLRLASRLASRLAVKVRRLQVLQVVVPLVLSVAVQDLPTQVPVVHCQARIQHRKVRIQHRKVRAHQQVRVQHRKVQIRRQALAQLHQRHRLQVEVQ